MIRKAPCFHLAFSTSPRQATAGADEALVIQNEGKMIVHHPYPNRWDERRAKLPGLPWMDWPWTALDCPGLPWTGPGLAPGLPSPEELSPQHAGNPHQKQKIKTHERSLDTTHPIQRRRFPAWVPPSPVLFPACPVCGWPGPRFLSSPRMGILWILFRVFWGWSSATWRAAEFCAAESACCCASVSLSALSGADGCCQRRRRYCCYCCCCC